MSQNTSGTVSVDFPASLIDSGMDSQYIKEAVAAVSYYNGTLSEKEACTLTHSTRRQFEEMILPRFGLSVIGGSPGDAEIEVID